MSICNDCLENNREKHTYYNFGNKVTIIGGFYIGISGTVVDWSRQRGYGGKPSTIVYTIKSNVAGKIAFVPGDLLRSETPTKSSSIASKNCKVCQGKPKEPSPQPEMVGVQTNPSTGGFTFTRSYVVILFIACAFALIINLLGCK